MGRAAELRPDVDDELLALLVRVRPSLLELVSLWPEGQQKQLALDRKSTRLNSSH